MNKEEYHMIKASQVKDSGSKLLVLVLQNIMYGDPVAIRLAQRVEKYHPDVWQRNHWLRFLGGYNPDLPAEQMRADVLAEIEDDLREFEESTCDN